MGAHANFDPVTKLITLTTAPDVDNNVTLDTLIDLYSDAKEDWLANPSFRGFALPFRTIGGDDLGGGIDAGAYFFLRNDLGWRIRPYEAHHNLTITGNLYAQDVNLPITVPTLGPYTVSFRLTTSSLTQRVSTKEQIAEEVRIELTPELANMDTTVSSRATQASIDAMQIDIDAVTLALSTVPADTWEELLTGTFPAGSMGEKMQQVLTTGNFIALK